MSIIENNNLEIHLDFNLSNTQNKRRIQLIEVWGEPDSIQPNEDIWKINDEVSLRVNSNNKGVVVICGLLIENRG